MILCFDIGGTAIKPAEAFSPADLRPSGRIPTPAHDFEAFLAALRGVIDRASQPPRALSFSMAGVTEAGAGRAMVANIPCLTGRPLRSELEQHLGLPVCLTNDADAFALAEAVQGAGRGHEVVFGAILGTGIGGGVVVRGELINRAGGFAGEWGHGPVAQRLAGQPAVELPAFPCGCGLSGCLDAICSARGMEKLHRHLHGLDGRCEAIIADWQAGDGAAGRTVAIWLELLSGPLAMVQNLLGAGIIAVGGGLSASAPLIAALDRQVRAHVLTRLDRPLVVPAQCRTEPGLVGAAIIGQRMVQGVGGQMRP